MNLNELLVTKLLMLKILFKILYKIESKNIFFHK